MQCALIGNEVKAITMTSRKPYDDFLTPAIDDMIISVADDHLFRLP